jgi:putative heme-binding domain-containing protein
MRSVLCCVAALSLLLIAIPGRSQNKKNPYAGHIAPTPPRSPADEKKAFHLPPGFEAQLVAAEPDIHKPLNLRFDDHGRLWVTETVEYPFRVSGGHKPRDAVKILEDFGPDGRARKITTFADGLNIPIGVLPLPGTHPQDALVFSIPNLYRMRDSEGIGYADVRCVLFSKYGFRDTHGLTGNFAWGFDGWVYACHGFSNSSTVRDRAGNAITMQSGNVYRLRPDGSRIEYFTHGQVNPFGLTFDPLGNLYSADCHTKPVYQLLRGAWYPSFGKPHDGLGFGPEMVHHDHGSTAISGINYYAADAFPRDFQGNLFIGNVVTNRINRDKIEWHGSSPRGIAQPDFLRSDDPWFRPVDIQLGPDGALYVADFYNRIIGHYEVPLDHPGRDRERGRIWRIVYTGADHKVTPAPKHDATKASVAELAGDLGHPNLAVRIRATNQLVERRQKQLPEISTAMKAILNAAGKKDEATARQRVHALWVLERCDGLEDALVKQAARDPARAVRVHVQRVLAERVRLQPELRSLVVAALKDADVTVRRAAADALGQHADAGNLRPLLDLRHGVVADDTHLLHVVRMALRNQLLPASTWQKLAGQQWSERDRRALADVCLGAANAEAAAFLLDHLRHVPMGRAFVLDAVHHIARYGKDATRAQVLAFVRGHEPGNLGLQVALFRALERGTQERGAGLSDAVRTWATDLTGKLLAAKNAGDVQAGIELVGALRMTGHQAKLRALAKARRTPEGQRKAALRTLTALDARGNALVLGTVLGDAASPMGLREEAANLLAGANQPETQAQLLLHLPAAPARLQNVIAAGLVGSKNGAEKLLDAVVAGKASARLLQERLVALRLKDAKIPGLKERLAKLTRGLPPADQHLQELLKRRRSAFRKAKKDTALGMKVFEKNCAACHQIANKGARIGPQLDGIGIRGLDRLLEDVLDPNRNVDQAFRLSTLELKRGQVVTGLLLKEEGAILVLADSQGKEVRVAKKDVEERTVSQMSPMPANFADQISEADFNNLLAYLLAQKPAGLDKEKK